MTMFPVQSAHGLVTSKQLERSESLPLELEILSAPSENCHPIDIGTLRHPQIHLSHSWLSLSNVGRSSDKEYERFIDEIHALNEKAKELKQQAGRAEGNRYKFARVLKKVRHDIQVRRYLTAY